MSTSKNKQLEVVLKEIQQIHDSKSQGYGLPDKPFHNLEEAGRLINVPSWVAAISRAGDKITRISSHLHNRTIEDEKLRDNLIDLVTYCAIALALYDMGEPNA
jgi:hypothetical protein